MGPVFPDRQRCRACRNYFGFIVVRGRFCSWDCAGMPAPSSNREDWPREHRTVSRGVPAEKCGYRCEQDALDYLAGARLLAVKEPYECGYCGMWHVGGRLERKEDPEPTTAKR